MTEAVRPAADAGAPWTVLEPVGQLSIAGATYHHRVLARMPAEALAERGIVRAEVVETAPPEGVKLLGSTVADVDGTPTRVWSSEPFTLAELKAAALAEADLAYEARRTSPMPWDFGATTALDDLGVSQGPAGVQTLQMREAPRDDLKNWLAVQAGAAAAVAAGAGAMVQPIKTTANVWVQASAALLMQVLATGDGAQLSALQRGVAQLQRYGELKALIATAEDAAAVAAARAAIATGWPA